MSLGFGCWAICVCVCGYSRWTWPDLGVGQPDLAILTVCVCVYNLLAHAQVGWGCCMHTCACLHRMCVCVFGRCCRYAADQFKPYKPIVVQ